jgi:phage FluMu protein Com
MPIEVFCQACQKKLRVPDTAAGKRIKCPKCQGVLNVPATAEAAPGSLSGAIPTPSKVASKSSASIPVQRPVAPTPKSAVTKKMPVEQWFVQADDGQQYGPVSRLELNQWHADGRITTETQILREGSEQWQWASDLYPDLLPAEPAAGGMPDFGAMTTGGAAPSGGSGPFDFGAGPSTPAATTSSVTARGKKGGKKGKSGGKKGGGSPHIDYIAYATYALGGMGMLVFLLVLIGGGSVAAYIGGNAKGAGAVAGTMGVVVTVISVLGMLMCSIWFAAGYGLQQRASWGRMLTLVLAIVGALSLSPINIGFAIWCWVVLTDKDNAAVFA